MLNPYPDELLHSFIFRLHLVYGVTCQKGVIGSTGKWRGIPVFRREHSQLYTDIDESEVLSSLKRINIAGQKDQRFRWYPFKYRKELASCLDAGDGWIHVTHKTRSIKFCYKCIREQLLKFGVGYIRDAWFHNEYCDTHDCPLHCLDDQSHTNAIFSLKTILSGDMAERSFELAPLRYQRYSRDSFLPHRFAKCASEEFHKFVRDQGSSFPERVSKVIRTKNVQFMAEANLSKPYFKEQIHDALVYCKFEPYYDFAERRFEKR